MSLLKVISVTLMLLICKSAYSAESTYVGNQRFLPLPPPSNKAVSQNHLNSAPAKFFSLNRSNITVPVKLAAKTTKDSTVPLAKSAQIDYPTGKSSAKTDMSPEQAQQILSIFAGNK